MVAATTDCRLMHREKCTNDDPGPLSSGDYRHPHPHTCAAPSSALLAAPGFRSGNQDKWLPKMILPLAFLLCFANVFNVCGLTSPVCWSTQTIWHLLHSPNTPNTCFPPKTTLLNPSSANAAPVPSAEDSRKLARKLAA